MASRSFAGGTVRVVVPASFDAKASRVGGRRSLPGQPGHAAEVSKAALLEALQDNGFDHVQSIDVAPRRGRDLDPTTGPAPRPVALDVDVPPGDDAGNSTGRISTEAVGHQPLAPRHRLIRARVLRTLNLSNRILHHHPLRLRPRK